MGSVPLTSAFSDKLASRPILTSVTIAGDTLSGVPIGIIVGRMVGSGSVGVSWIGSGTVGTAGSCPDCWGTLAGIPAEFSALLCSDEETRLITIHRVSRDKHPKTSSRAID